MANKNNFLNSRFTDFEMQLLDQLALHYQFKRSEVMRYLLRDEAKRIGIFNIQVIDQLESRSES